MAQWANFTCKVCDMYYVYPSLVDEVGVTKLHDHAKGCGASVSYQDFMPRDQHYVHIFETE